MTLLELKQRVLTQMGEDTGAGALSEYGDLLGDYLNEAYLQICRHKRQKLTEETLSFENKRAAIGSLSKTATVILDVENADGAAKAFAVLADHIFLTGAEDGDYTVRYLHLPDRLTLDTDVPDLPEQEGLLLADFATYRALSLGNPTRQKRAEFFLMRYLSGYSDQKAKQTQIVNKY